MSTLSDRGKIGTLRGLLYALKFAIEEKDAQGLEHELLHDEIVRVLDETKGGPNDDLAGEWRPGYAYSGLTYWPIRVGAKLRYMSHDESFDLTVIARDPSGQVHLRPEPTLVERLNEWYPPGAHDKKNPNRCPFLRVDAKAAQRGEKDGLREGDLLCHEAWGAWRDFSP